eukprot:11281554-Ditylum_brightwellii.AAC.1
MEGILVWEVEEEKKTKEQQHFPEREHFLGDKRKVNDDNYHFDSKSEGILPNKQRQFILENLSSLDEETA